MKKITFLAVLFLFVGGITYGQEKQTTTNDNYKYANAIDVAYEVSFPMGNLSNGAASSWAGTTARYEFNMGKGWAGMITTGYLSFTDKNSQSYSAIPLMIGTKLHFVAGWYGMVETGFHFFSTSGPTAYSSPVEWGYSVGTGYEIPLSKLLSIDLSTKYQYNTDNLSYWNTRAGLMFKF
jgi:hypothetical protein